MEKYIINGSKKLKGDLKVSGSKNVVLKALVAACLTKDEVELLNIPLISDFYLMADLVRQIGGKVDVLDHKVKIKLGKIKSTKIPLEIGAKTRTSSMFLAPLLAREKEAIIPNPGGCRIGARPIDRHIHGLEKMGAKIKYDSQDGYFHAKTEDLKGCDFTFEKNSHTGTETLIIAGVLAKGRTVIRNAAEEPEVSDLINMLNKMGARIERKDQRVIVIEGVEALHGVSYKIMPDRNELITFALISSLTGGEILIKNGDLSTVSTFLNRFREAGGNWEMVGPKIRFYLEKSVINPTSIDTGPYPGFMTDWHSPWAIFMTQAHGVSKIHETVYENRFGYVDELSKMGAKISLFNPKVENPKELYNFNYEDMRKDSKHAIKITGKTPLHDAVLDISDLRAGATLVMAALIAKGESVIYGVEHIARGYERFDERLRALGADIKLVEEKYEKQ